jgi:hypothetical protein
MKYKSLVLLVFVLTVSPLMADGKNRILFKVGCEGTYQHHLQGICAGETEIYWCFTTTLVKTDLEGNLLKKVPVANHHGDPRHHFDGTGRSVSFPAFGLAWLMDSSDGFRALRLRLLLRAVGMLKNCAGPWPDQNRSDRSAVLVYLWEPILRPTVGAAGVRARFVCCVIRQFVCAHV